MIVYHYARMDHWGLIKESDVPGLKVDQGLSMLDPRGRQIQAIYGLLNPAPDEWTKNTEFPHIWDKLKNNVGKLLLEIDVPNSIPYMIDWGHREGVLVTDKSKLPPRYQHETDYDAERAYVDSLIPIDEYLAKKDELNYSVPEVVITQNIPYDKIRVSSQQPLLEGVLESYRGDFLRRRICEIKAVPELQPWYQDYLERHIGHPEKLGGFQR